MPSDIHKGLAACAIVLATFAAGRFSAPEKVRVETRTVEVHAQVDEKTQTLEMRLDRDQHREVVITQIQRPDGTRETTTRTVSDSELRRSQASSQEQLHSDTVSKETDVKKEVTRGSGKLDVALLAGPSLSLSSGVGPVVFGIHISRPLLGPVTVGLFGMSNGVAGASVGLQF